MTLQMPFAFYYIARGVNQDRDQPRIIIRPAMQKEQARLRRDRHPDLIRQFQSAAAFKALLGEEHLHVAEQFRLILGREPVKERHVARDDRAPFVRHRLRAQLPPPPLPGESKHEW